MGEVYRAVDTRLGRTVAIKVISDHWRDRPDLRARFKIEAEAVAALNHPHIAQLFDIGQTSDVDYLVMELVDGETLADRLARGRLPPKEALDHARTLADALGHAHRRGIAHRDVKPGNVLLTRSGGLKLLDFGLARIGEQHGAGVAAVSTVVAAGGLPLTQTGAALGTWQYMAPEQIRGEPADKRSDVFALGAVIYEMLSGRRPFDRGDQHHTIAAVLQDDPGPVGAAAPLVAPAVERVVLTCLAKDPDERWQSADEVRRALDTALVPGESSRDRRSIGGRSAAVAVGAVGIAAALAAWPWSTPHVAEPTSGRTTRSVIALPANIAAAVGSGSLAFAPDGTSIVYAAITGAGELRRYRLADGVDSAIAGTTGGFAPFFAPDGRWLGFFAGGSLRKVSADGGTPTILCPAQSAFGASWGADDFIVFSHLPETGLFRIRASGGTPELLTRLAPADTGNDHRFPEVLPGGRAILYSVGTGPEDTARVVVMDLASGRRIELIQGAASARFAPPDHIAYARNGELFASPFSLDRLELTGSPRRLAAGVAELTDGNPEYAFSGSGDLVYFAGKGPPQNRLAFLDLNGAMTLAEAPPQFLARPRVSPDGGTVAYYVGAAKNNIWLYDIARGTATRRTFGRFHEPVWRSDGRLAAAEGGPGSQQIVLLSRDGGGSNEVLVEKGVSQFPETWSPDGGTLVYRVTQPQRQENLWALTIADRQRRAIAPSAFDQRNARFSPNGRWLAYLSNETGQFEVYVRAVGGTGGHWPISSGGASLAVWAPTGRQIYYRDLADGFWVADVTETAGFAASRPRLLFQRPGMSASFDITRDGRRFVVSKLDPAQQATQLQLVLNPLSPTADANRPTATGR
jgi:Tol biopolymer transport system component